MNNGIHVEDELSAYLDGECAAAREVEAHLRTCPACSQRLHELRAVTTQVRRLRAPEVQPEFVSRVLKQVRDEAREAAVAPWWSPGRWGVLLRPAPVLAFSAVAAILVGVVAFRALEAPAPRATVAGPVADAGMPESDGAATPAALRDLSAAGVDVAALADSLDANDDTLDDALENGLDPGTAALVENAFLAMLDAGWSGHGDDAFAALDEMSPEEEDEALLGALMGGPGGETNEG